MPTKTGIRWIEPPAKLAQAVEKYGARVLDAVGAAMGAEATEMANEARQNAPWSDRTGNARSGIFGTVEVDYSSGTVTLYLSHGVVIDYGIWLELAHGGRFSIIEKTINSKLPDVKAALDALFD